MMGFKLPGHGRLRRHKGAKLMLVATLHGSEHAAACAVWKRSGALYCTHDPRNAQVMLGVVSVQTRPGRQSAHLIFSFSRGEVPVALGVILVCLDLFVQSASR